MSTKRELKYIGIDYWSRPIFKDKNDNLFCSLNKLFPDGASFEDVTGTNGQEVTERDIVYFGRDLDDDPMGTSIDPNKIKLVKEWDT